VGGATALQPFHWETRGAQMADTTINAPVPGTFYRRPSPDEEPYANEGDRIANGQVIGLVEVMKNFNEVKTDRDGVIASFLVEDEDLVEAGQEIAALTDE
jgi:acetyl-CoA carboxylase biotin carboxyl carrier protein